MGLTVVWKVGGNGLSKFSHFISKFVKIGSWFLVEMVISYSPFGENEKIMENLGKNKTYIRDFFRMYGYSFVDDVNKTLGEKCTIIGIENYPSYEYYKIETICPYDRNLFVSKKANSFVVSVEKGIFAGSTCVVEQDSGIEKSTQISVVSKEGIFKFPAYEGLLSDFDIDFLLGNKGLCSAIANEVAVYDITKQYQYFEHMFDQLPEAFWQNYNMVRNVLQSIDFSTIKYLNVAHPEVIDEDKVKASVREKFLEYAIKHNKEFEELEK